MNFKKDKSDLHKKYWDTKYSINDVGWDLGTVSPPIKGYIDQLTDKTIKILIPGAGNSYEAEYLFNRGFKNVHVLDISNKPLENLKKRVAEFPEDNLIQEDFWLHNSAYDLIIEQTFFCAIHPDLRTEYVKKTSDLLNQNGKIIGLLFMFELNEIGPPFGGSSMEYEQLFENEYNLKTLKSCYNSIKPRIENELFFIFEKKK